MFILALIPLVLIVICFKRETKVTSVYKYFGVYGRFSAYITATFLLAGITSAVGALIAAFTMEEGSIAAALGSIVGGLLLFAVGLLLYKRIANRCPAPLKKKLFISILITAFGVAAKICLFFFGFVWNFIEPKDYTGPNGEELTVFNGEVYDKLGNHVGSISGHNTFKPNKNFRR